MQEVYCVWGSVTRWLFSVFFLCVLSSCAPAKGISPAGGSEGAASPVPAAVTAGPSVDAKPLQTATATGANNSTPTPASFKDYKALVGDQSYTLLDKSFDESANIFNVKREVDGALTVSVNAGHLNPQTGEINNANTEYKVDMKSLTAHKNYGTNYITDNPQDPGHDMLRFNNLTTIEGTKTDANGVGKKVTLIYDRASNNWLEQIDLISQVPTVTKETSNFAVLSYYILLEDSLEKAAIDKIPSGGNWWWQFYYYENAGYQLALMPDDYDMMEVSTRGAIMVIDGQKFVFNFVVLGNDANNPEKLMAMLLMGRFGFPITSEDQTEVKARLTSLKNQIFEGKNAGWLLGIIINELNQGSHGFNVFEKNLTQASLTQEFNPETSTPVQLWISFDDQNMNWPKELTTSNRSVTLNPEKSDPRQSLGPLPIGILTIGY